MKTCEDVMTQNPKCCLPTDTAADVAQVMKRENIGSVPVCEDRRGNKLIGVVTDRDLAMKIVAEGRDPRTTRVSDVMTRNPITCHPEDDLQQALEAMERRQVRRVPVVANGGTLVGIIAQADIATRGDEPEMTAEVVEVISRHAAVH